VPQGVVKTYDPTTGYGVVVPDEGGAEVYLRPGSRTRAVLRMRRPGPRLILDVTSVGDRSYAGNIRVGQGGY